MAKLVPDDRNRFRSTWQNVRENEGSREMMADSLGIDRGRLNDLILGRTRPTLGETTALTGKRRGNYIVYRDERGKEHSAYTGRNKSFEDMVDDWENMDEMLEDIGYDRDYPAEGNRVLTIKNQFNHKATYHSLTRRGYRPGKSLGYYTTKRKR